MYMLDQQGSDSPRQIHITIHGLSRRQLILGLTGLSASILTAVIAIIYIQQHTGLSAITGHIDAFTPYYFRHNQPPDGYQVDKSETKYSDGLLAISLTKNDQSVVINEQAAPSGLNPDTLVGKGTKIKDAPGLAAISNVEGRTVGVLLPTGSHTLIILNANAGFDHDQMTDLLKAFRPTS